MFLPTEIFFEIFEFHKGDRETLRSLRLVNKQFSQIVTPFWKAANIRLVEGVEHSISQMRAIIDTGQHSRVVSICISRASFWPRSTEEAKDPIWKGMSAEYCEDPNDLNTNFEPKREKFKEQSELYLRTVTELLERCQNLQRVAIHIEEIVSVGARDSVGREKHWGKMFVPRIFPAIAKSTASEICINPVSGKAFFTILSQTLLYRRPSHLRSFPSLRTVKIRMQDRVGLDPIAIAVLRRDVPAFFFEIPSNYVLDSNVPLDFGQSYIGETAGPFFFTYTRSELDSYPDSLFGSE
ncbi:hypothetical protein TWF281_011491 [Arthrobotrys megalospora]